ncbi:hypothetical protein ACHAXS_007595 [Conticribra weissflogii]
MILTDFIFVCLLSIGKSELTAGNIKDNSSFGLHHYYLRREGKNRAVERADRDSLSDGSSMFKPNVLDSVAPLPESHGRSDNPNFWIASNERVLKKHLVDEVKKPKSSQGQSKTMSKKSNQKAEMKNSKLEEAKDKKKNKSDSSKLKRKKMKKPEKKKMAKKKAKNPTDNPITNSPLTKRKHKKMKKSEKKKMARKKAKNSINTPTTSPPPLNDASFIFTESFHLALVQEPVGIRYDETEEIESLVQKFLDDNIGDLDTFSPISSTITDREVDRQIRNEGSSDEVESIAWKIDVSFSMKYSFEEWIEDIHGQSRRLRGSKRACNSRDFALCCANRAINSGKQSDYCKSKKCYSKKCLKKKRTKIRLLIPSKYDIDDRRLVEIDKNLNGKSFPRMLSIYTQFQPLSVNSVLNSTDTANVATCSVNRYTFDENGYFPCDLYVEKKCDENEDISFRPDESYCHSEEPSQECSDPRPECDDGNHCTSVSSSCIDGVWECSHTPSVSCHPGLSCDPVDGFCKSNDQLVPCVAVIDEDTDFQKYEPKKTQEQLWAEFRASYPSRPFCLLVVEELNDGAIKPEDLPTNFQSDPNVNVHFGIKRDYGDVLKAENWMNLCRLGSYTPANVQFVGLFIDNSSSMRESHVHASHEKFVDDLKIKDIEVKSAPNGRENWIYPFMKELVPSIQ